MACFSDVSMLCRNQRTDDPDVLGKRSKAVDRFWRLVRLTPLTLVAIGSGVASLIQAIHGLVEVDDHSAQEQRDRAGGALQDLVVNMNQSLSAPGLCHIIQNAVHSCTGAVEHFSSTWFDQAKNVCNLLRRKNSKQRLIETCFKHPLVCHQRHLIDAFSHTTHRDCWGCLLEPAAGLRALETPFREAWNAQFFQSFSTSARPVPHQSRHHRRCHLFPRLLFLFVDGARVAAVAAPAFNWLRSCSCHASKAAVRQ